MTFALSLAICPVSATAAEDSVLIAASELRYRTMSEHGQYMAQRCTPVTLSSWPNIPTQRCSYVSLNTRAEVTLILPDAIQLATWTVTACRDASAVNMEKCVQHIEKRIWSASNAQFVVSGYVIEPRLVLGGNSNEPLCFLFRDGVTVRTASVTARAPQNGKCAPQSAENDPVVLAFSYARVASTTRAELARVPGAPSIDQLAGLAFPNAVRAEFTSAWTSPRNRLISGAAISDKALGKFN
jgi:hypothetical protein